MMRASSCLAKVRMKLQKIWRQILDAQAKEELCDGVSHPANKTLVFNTKRRCNEEWPVSSSWAKRTTTSG